ncbi:MAG: ATP-binding protein [Candidatus Margulisiibacteriota bacterium]
MNNNNNNHFYDEALRMIRVSRIRWTALASVALTILMCELTGLQLHLKPIFITLFIIFLYNLIILWFARLQPEACKSSFCNYLQFLADIIAVTTLVHFTGGLESPFVVLYLLFTTIAAIFYGTSFAIMITGHAVIFFALVNRLEFFGVIKHYTIAIPPIILYRDPRFLFLYAVSFFFISLAIIYAVSYLADKFREKQQQVEELADEKLDFMNNVAHELRSPLTSIKEYTSLFMEGLMGPLAQNQRDTIEVIDRQAKRIIKLISDLLDVAQIESHHIKLEKKEHNIEHIIDNAVIEMQPQLNLKKAVIIKRIEPALPQIKVDEIKILEVLINLLSNAIKFSNEGGKITITAKRSGLNIFVSIEDEGKGVDSADLPHIFEKFYRARQGNSKVQGTGLGLALSKDIVERHGGQIWAESPGLERGTTVIFTLPIKKNTP